MWYKGIYTLKRLLTLFSIEGLVQSSLVVEIKNIILGLHVNTENGTKRKKKKSCFVQRNSRLDVQYPFSHCLAPDPLWFWGKLFGANFFNLRLPPQKLGKLWWQNAWLLHFCTSCWKSKKPSLDYFFFCESLFCMLHCYLKLCRGVLDFLRYSV